VPPTAKISRESLIAILRMLVQLLLTGYLLKHLFAGEYPALISLVIMVMLTLSSWISSRGLEHRSWRLYLLAFISISRACTIPLGLARAL
jgi:ABC-type iron transport system FetAB permease component